MATFPVHGRWLTPVLLYISFAVQSRKDDPQAPGATWPWTRGDGRLPPRGAVSMTPLLPPSPSLTDARYTPARCISTGDPRRSTVKEVGFKTQCKMEYTLGVWPIYRSWVDILVT